MNETKLDRRKFLKISGQIATVAPFAGLVLSQLTGCTDKKKTEEPAEAPKEAPSKDAAEEKMVTDIPENKGLLDSLQYVAESNKKGQTCDNCQFYTATGDGKGKCSIIPNGLVHAKGYCVSWQKKA